MNTRFALDYLPDGYSVAGQKLMGRQAAGVGLMRAIARSEGIEALGCFTSSAAHAAECERDLRGFGYGGPVEWVGQDAPQELARYGILYHPAPGIERLAWRRLPLGERSYSLCGITHTTASHAIMSGIAGLLAAPVRSWDAVICTSRVVRDSVRQILERQAEYLRARLGAQRFELPQLPVIPLGVHCRDLAFDAPARVAARAALDIGADDVAFLFVGRLSFHAKAHPQQMFAALEHARKDGRKVHLLLSGWFANDAIEKAFHDGAAALCPSVRLQVLDGRVPENQARAWSAADVFTSLSDNIQETFGLTPVEAMAAGLPVVVSDWNGYRDTVRDGVDGFRIATALPEPGAGADLARRYDDGTDSYDRYCGHTSQAVAVDGAALARAYERLILDPALRQTMGENARRHALDDYDWSVVLRRYRTLWNELDERRRAEPDLYGALPTSIPDRLDPFVLFASYPSVTLSAQSHLRVAPHASPALVRQYRQLGMNRFAASSLPALEDIDLMLAILHDGAHSAGEVLARFDQKQHMTVLRGLAWLCKMDLVHFA